MTFITLHTAIWSLILILINSLALKVKESITHTTITSPERSWTVASPPKRKVRACLGCCGKLSSNTECRKSWRAVRASGCWLSHLSWLSQQDVTAALSLLPADHWAWHPLHSPAPSPPSPLSTLASLSPQRVCSRNEDQHLGVKDKGCWLTISDGGLTRIRSGCWLQFVSFWECSESDKVTNLRFRCEWIIRYYFPSFTEMAVWWEVTIWIQS